MTLQEKKKISLLEDTATETFKNETQREKKLKGIKASVRAQFTQWREDSEKILEEIMIKFFSKFDKNL